MARGRGPSALNADVVQVTTRRRGVDYDDYDPISHSRRVAHLTATTAEDLDAIQNRSRRTDQALLSDINNKLAYADFAEPMRPIRRGSISGARRIVVVPTSAPAVRQFRQSTPPPPRVVTVNSAGVSRGRRATSVPPMPTQTRIVQEEDYVFPSYRPPPRRVPLGYSYVGVAPARPVVHAPPPPVYTHVPPRPMASRRRRAGSEPPMDVASDRAVRNARHQLQRLEAEIGVREFEPSFTPVVVPSRQHVYRAASVPPRHVGSVQVPMGRRGSVVGPPMGRRGSIVGQARRPYLVTRSVVIPRSPSPVRQRLLIDVEDSYVPPSKVTQLPYSLGSLRSKTVEARNKLDQARSMYDRYLPVPTGALQDVQSEVDIKYGELAARIPSLEKHSGRTSYFGAVAPVAPYKPAQVGRDKPGTPDYMTSALRHPPPRPKVSQVRRHARNVLCRSKGDPNYYSY